MSEQKGSPLMQSMHDLMADDKNLVNDVSAVQLLCPGILPGVCGCFLCPCLSCCAYETVSYKNEKVLLSLGKYLGTLKRPGCYCVNPCCVTVKNVSTAMKAANLDNVKVADGRGNPLLLSGVVTFRVLNSKQAALDVADYENFVRTQGTTVMKKVASMYPYEARGNEPSLKSEAEHLRQSLVSLLQERVNVAGMQIVNFELNDLAYAPEIAQQMLVRQQAEAVVDARKVIAHGAVEIVKETIKGLSEQGINMSADERARMASNLVVVVCGEGSVTPVMNVGSSSGPNS
jgi:regulator of protease activity HflC (stomatin/prohibitin superfamily)